MAPGHVASIPKGYRFKPTNKEVFDHYLSRKNLGQEDFSDYVPDIDVTKLDPWELRDKYKGKLSHQRNEKEWWFFWPRTREGTTKRTTGSGWWKSGKGKEILDGGKIQKLGTMKTSTFCRGSRSSYKTDNWILHEYHLPNLPLQDKETYYVFCCLNENDGKAKNKTVGEVGHPGLSGIDQQEVRQRNREISSQAPPSKRPKEPTDAPSGHWNEGSNHENSDELIQTILGSFASPDPLGGSSLESVMRLDGVFGDPSSSAQQNARLFRHLVQSAKPLSGVVPAEDNSLKMSPVESLMLLGYCFLRLSPELLEEVGPAEGKTASVENRNAKSQPSSPVSPSIVARLKGFKASKSSAPAESFPKARAPMGKPTAANPLAKETKEKSRPKSKCENQDPSTLPPSKNSTDAIMEKFSRLELQDKKKGRN